MSTKGVLYIVATPIGNLGDITIRALEILKSVDVVAAEDTRHSQKLLQHFGIEARMHAYHDHNDATAVGRLIDMLEQGLSIALISDAGTPLISDPGYKLVHDARHRGLNVVPIPGPSAVITALSAAGVSTDRFSFEGFLPAKTTARSKSLSALKSESRTMVFYESPHRISESLRDAINAFGGSRSAVLARELTKTFETFLAGSLEEIKQQVDADENQRRGELVLIIKGEPKRVQRDVIDENSENLLKTLLEELPTKQVASLAAKITGLPKNLLYQRVLELRSDDS